jgi:hypothetical protein
VEHHRLGTKLRPNLGDGIGDRIRIEVDNVHRGVNGAGAQRRQRHTADVAVANQGVIIVRETGGRFMSCVGAAKLKPGC